MFTRTKIYAVFACCLVGGGIFNYSAHAEESEMVGDNLKVGSKYAASRLLPESGNNPPLVLQPWTTIGNISNGCKTITNSSDDPIFVPYNSQEEWDAFLAYAEAGGAGLNLKSEGCCPPLSVPICGVNTPLGYRSAIYRNGDSSDTLANYGAEGDVFGPYEGAGNYKVTYKCSNKSWIKISETGNCSGTAVCGSNHGKTLGSLATSGTRMCANGTYSNLTPSNLYAGPWDWKCDLIINGVTSSVDCHADYVETPLKGSCGYPNNKWLATMPASVSCGMGVAPGPISSTGGGPPFKWTCDGLYNGTSVNCSTLTAAPGAGQPVYGSCGTANDTYVPVKPTTNLCASGSATAVSGAGPWSWKCNGANGGTTANCNAYVCNACAGEYNEAETSSITQRTVDSCIMDVKYTWTERRKRVLTDGESGVTLLDSMGGSHVAVYPTTTAAINYCKPCNVRPISISDAKFHYRAKNAGCGGMSTEFVDEPVAGSSVQ